MSEREFILQLTDEQIGKLVEMMFLAADSDGEITSEELEELAGNIERATNGHVQREQADRWIEKARSELSASDRATRLAAIRDALPEGQRRHALLLAIKVVASDGIIRTSERELILETAEALGINGDSAADLVHAVTRPDA